MNLITNVSYKVVDVYNNNELVEQKKKEKDDCIIILATSQYQAINQKLNFYIKKLSEMRKHLNQEEIVLLDTKIKLYAVSLECSHKSVKVTPIKPNKYETLVLNYIFQKDIDRPFGINNNFSGFRERNAKAKLSKVPKDILEDYIEKYSW